CGNPGDVDTSAWRLSGGQSRLSASGDRPLVSVGAGPQPMTRLDCLRAIYPALQNRVVVTIMGAVAAELQSIGHRQNFFYLQHAMGLASSMGLGIALSRPDQKVVVIDGDGSALMNLGTFTTLARYAPPNLIHIVFDNE